MERIGVYIFRAGPQSEPAHIAPVPAGALLPNGSLPIHEVHVRGLVHSGIWVHILDAKGRLLLLRRTAALKTCPGTWGLLGEHQHAGEGLDALLRRAVAEEIGPQVLPLVAQTANLTDAPLWYRRDYPDGRVDRQATWLVAIFLSVDGEHVPLAPDEEVAEYRWAELVEIDRLLGSSPSPFCHATLTSLLREGVRLLSGLRRSGAVP